MSTIAFGDTVTLKNDNLVGVVKFIGHIEQKPDIFYGIELQNPTKGKNNGSIDRISYFNCKPKAGVFVTKPSIAKINAINKPTLPRVQIGDTVQCTRANCTGVIKYVGPFKNMNVYYGAELQKPNGKCNGTIDGRQYFKCKDRHGIFLQSTQFTLIQNMPTSKKTVKIRNEPLKKKLSDTITIGDSVKVKNNIKGIVRFAGEIHGKNDIFYGIELYLKKGNNNGSIDNIVYFECDTNKGLFVREAEITKTNTNMSSNTPRVIVSDKVKCLKPKCIGTIRFIGHIYSNVFQKSVIYYGIQLSKAMGNNNGTMNGRQYFKCKSKCGIFLESHDFIPIKRISAKSKTLPTAMWQNPKQIPTYNGKTSDKTVPSQSDNVLQNIAFNGVKNNDGELDRLKRLLSAKNNEIAKQKRMCEQLQKELTEMKRNSETEKSTDLSHSLDVTHNKKHKQMFNHFIKSVYEVTFADYAQLTNQSSPIHTMHDSNIRKQFAKEISKAALEFYKQSINTLHSHKNASANYHQKRSSLLLANSATSPAKNDLGHSPNFSQFDLPSYQSTAKSLPRLPAKLPPKPASKYKKTKRKRRNTDSRDNKYENNNIKSRAGAKSVSTAPQRGCHSATKFEGLNHVNGFKIMPDLSALSKSQIRFTDVNDRKQKSQNHNAKHEFSQTMAVGHGLKQALGSILLPGQDTPDPTENKNEWGLEDDSDYDTSPLITKKKPKFKNIPSIDTHRIRRNSDTVVYTPTLRDYASGMSGITAFSGQSGSVSPRHLVNADAVMNNILYGSAGFSNINAGNVDLSMVNEDAINFKPVIIDERKRRNRQRRGSAPETPTAKAIYSAINDNIFDIPTMSSPTAPLPDTLEHDTHNKPLRIKVKKRQTLPPKNTGPLHQKNKDMIDKMVGFDGSSWDFGNEIVDVFNEQCKNVKYETLVPSLVDIMYPTMLSSLALPTNAKFASYVVTVKYNLCSFVTVEDPKLTPTEDEFDENVYVIKLEFSSKTTTKMAIEEVLYNIKKTHAQHAKFVSKLRLDSFILKVCGREEYLKYNNKNNKIISLSHIRNCIRRNHVHGMELVLLYDDSLISLNDNNIRKSLRKNYNRFYHKDSKKHSKNSRELLKYEQNGFNAIIPTLAATIGDNVDKLTTNLGRLNHDIEKELRWLEKKIGSKTDCDAVMTPSMSMSVMNKAEAIIQWDQISKDAILLTEFEHPIEFSVERLQNIMLCPRFRMKNNEYFTYVLRIELMFGLQIFEECSFDITIPKSKVSNKIKMPSKFCTFTTKTQDSNLEYSEVPREAVWCFTLYGIKKDISVEQDLKKQDKKKRKNEPKFLRAMLSKKKEKPTNSMQLQPRPNLHKQISSQSVFLDDVEQLITNEPINDFYSTRPDTGKTFNKSFAFEQNTPTETKSQYISEPMAWCRLPMVDHRHRLRKGKQSLKLWTVPMFEKVKGGPKIDPYTTNNWKKFGSTRDCNLRNQKHSVTLTVNFVLDYRFDVVAPIVNLQRPHYIRRKVKPNKRKQYIGAEVLGDIIQRDGIFPLNARDKLLVYSNKEKLMRDSSTIPTFLRSVNWLDQDSRMEAYDYLEKWQPNKNPEDMIELLRYEFADNRIRLYAINNLNHLDDYTLNRCLLQLVQALKYENHHSSFLSRFLIIRALHNPFQIGHYLFWHLKSEYHDVNVQFVERYGLLIREYLLHLPYYPLFDANINLAQNLFDENNLINRLKFIALTIKSAKSKKKVSKTNLMNLLQNELMRLNNEVFRPKREEKEITLPLNPSYKVCGLRVERCKYMSSAKVPLWLVFDASDQYYEDTISVMFKSGDDLRQDILTLQLMSIMDAFWLSSSIDLNMRTYEVIGTGYMVGMLEIILNSQTLNAIGSSFNNKSHLKYISRKTATNKHLDLNQKKSNYLRSAAGFSVATWALGIGDRHPDNIMVSEDGTLFHIDFGHFLGNFKEKDIGGFVKWKRERTPFVFTNAMKYCISLGKNDKNGYTQFVKFLFSAYCEIRLRYKFFVNLLLLMVSSQIPELITESDVSYFREILRFDLTDNESIASHVESTLKLCLSDKNKKFDDMMHNIKHL